MTAIKVELELADGSFTTRMLHAGETIAQFNQNVARSSPQLRAMAASGQSVVRTFEVAREKSQGFLGTLRDISIVVGVLGVGINKLANIHDTWIGKIVQTNAEFERLIFQMRSMSTATDPIKDAAENVEQLLDTAKKAPFSLDALTKGFTKLKAAGTDPLKGSLKAVADGVAAFGGTDSEFERAILGITQMSGKGVIQMEELRQQLGEAMPQAVQLMAASMGISMSKLIDAVGTGRVEASKALEGFYAQLDRSFGGTSVRMMQTFSGQLSKTKTLFMQFSRDVGGVDASTGLAASGGFFDAVTNAVRDFNDAMDSASGRNFARALGEGLTTVVTVGRRAVELLYQFRSEIGNLATMAAAFAGFKVASAAIRAIGDAYDYSRTRMRLFSVQSAATRASMMSLASASTSLSGLRSILGGLTFTGSVSGLFRLGTMAMRVAPMVGLVATVAYEVADALGIFDSKGQDAIKTLEEFGEVSADQLKLVKGSMDEMRVELEHAESQAWARTKRTFGIGFNFDKADAETQKAFLERYYKFLEDEETDYASKKKRLSELQTKAAAAEAKLQEEAAARASRAQIEAVDRVVATNQRNYREDLINIQNAHNERLAKMKETGEKEADIEQSRMDQLNDRNRTYLQGQVSEYEKLVAKIRAMRDQGPLSLVDTMTLKSAEEELNAALDKLNNYRSLKGVNLLEKTENTDKTADKAASALADVRGEVASLRAQLTGSNKELADFEAKLANNEFGDPATEGVKRFAEAMREAIGQKNALDEALEGRKDLDNDIAQAQQKLAEDKMALLEKKAGGLLTDGEKILLKLDNGLYKGLGPNSPAVQAISKTNEGMALSGRIAEQLGDVLSGNTFGRRTTTAIDAVINKLREVMGVMTNINTLTGQTNFGNMGNTIPSLSRTFGPNPYANKLSANDALLDLIASKESGGDYNSTLDNGRWTNGPQNLTSMTLNQIRELQRGMLTPENQAVHGDGGSSALGRYQIVGKTLQGLMDKMGLTGNELFDPAMQDRLARELIAGRQGQGTDGLRSEWEGLKNVSDAEILAAMNAGKGPTINKAVANGLTPTVPVQDKFTSAVPTMDAATLAAAKAFQESQAKFEADRRASVEQLIKDQKALNAETKDYDLNEEIKKAETAIKSAADSMDGLDKNYRAAQEYISKNKIDPNSDAAKRLLEITKEQDKVEKEMADRKSAKGQLSDQDVALKEQELQLSRQLAEAQAKMKDPNFKGQSSELDSLNSKLNEYVANVSTVYGKDSTEYQAAITRRAQMLDAFHKKEAYDEVAASAQRTREMNQSTLTTTQQRQQAMQQELAAVDSWLNRARAAGQSEVQIVQQAEAEKAAIRAKYAAQDPMSAKMREWSDLSGNMATGMANAMDSLADGLASVITGTGDLRSVLQGLLQQFVSMGLKAMFARMKTGGAKTATTAAAPATAGKKGATTAGTKGIFGAKHTGGIVGGSSGGLARMVNPAVFKGAKRFHSGSNQIGSGVRLLPGEVPIIAKKDEGIFTPEQMKAIGAGLSGGGQVISIHAPVNVNASGGTPDQNADLAKQVRKELEGTMRGVVADELRKQMKPSNMLGRRL
jgi:tape measure domain-containing protein